MSSLFSTGVRPAIDGYLLQESKKVRDYGEYWSASSGGYCMRKVIFERLGVPKIETSGDARRQRVFTAGHIFHSWIQELTKNAGISIAQETELQDEDLMIRGHIDDLVLVEQKEYLVDMIDPKTATKPEPRKHLILYDYKTVNSRSFTWAKKNGNAMSHYHRMQLGTYMYMLRSKQYKWRGKTEYTLEPNTLAESRILKISKDDLRMEEQQLLWTADLERDVVSYWRTLNGYWASQKMPACTCADYENGFLAKELYNGYFYEGEPCSLQYYKEWKDGKQAMTEEELKQELFKLDHIGDAKMQEMEEEL